MSVKLSFERLGDVIPRCHTNIVYVKRHVYQAGDTCTELVSSYVEYRWEGVDSDGEPTGNGIICTEGELDPPDGYRLDVLFDGEPQQDKDVLWCYTDDIDELYL